MPQKLLSKYGNIILKYFLLKFLNGYQILVMHNEEKGAVTGISTLYADLDLKAGEMIVFEFDGSSNFNVYVIGTDLLEIEYPAVVHHFQKTPPRNGMPFTAVSNCMLMVYLTILIFRQINLVFIVLVNVEKVGLKFVNFVRDEDPLIDEFVRQIPTSFQYLLNLHATVVLIKYIL